MCQIIDRLSACCLFWCFNVLVRVFFTAFNSVALSTKLHGLETLILIAVIKMDIIFILFLFLWMMCTFLYIWHFFLYFLLFLLTGAFALLMMGFDLVDLIWLHGLVTKWWSFIPKMGWEDGYSWCSESGIWWWGWGVGGGVGRVGETVSNYSK